MDKRFTFGFQSRRCPLKNHPESAESAEIFATMLRNGTVRIPTRMFYPETSFFVSIIVLPTNARCSIARYNTDDTYSKVDKTPKQKLVSVKLTLVPLPSSEYLLKPILIPIVIIVSIVIVSAAVLYFKLKILECCGEDETDTIDGPARLAIVDTTAPSLTTSTTILEVETQANGEAEANEVKSFIHDGILKIGNERLNSGKAKQSERIELSVNRLKKKPTYLDMSILSESNDWYRRNRSRVYFYIIPIVCAFYFVPAIQYSFQAKKNEDIFGNQDLCYHNFRYKTCC